MGGEINDGFRIGGGLQDIAGAVPPRKHKLHRNNIEQEENEKMTEQRIAGIRIKFPMHVHKVGGMVREVLNDQQLEDALAKGWKEDIRQVEELEPQEAPDRVSRMTPTQAAAFIAEHAGSAEKLVEIKADEEAHGNRPKVIALINEAQDNFGSKPKAKAKK